ncbi:hypothetical protein [Paenibacillus abyssi]|uniref:Hydrolase n=1 Tax=Paenibacillus abyssi TaxID=1340531 RepID=A0A917D229_9BACL|nr:hypothetical protein [Paenibacillus abyssi]GGG06220.1 hypothetical protein GCM10010916_24040 [Paenibacillus abyssi]
MDKTKYYVSVIANSILDNQGAASYELEILADDQDLAQLQELFDEKMKAEESTMIRASLPGIPYHIDDENDNYDYYLIEIYKKLHELGTKETKNHIEQMNIM